MNKANTFDRLKWTIDSTYGLYIKYYLFQYLICLIFNLENKKATREETPIFDGKTIQLHPMQIRSFIIKLIKT